MDELIMDDLTIARTPVRSQLRNGPVRSTHEYELTKRKETDEWPKEKKEWTTKLKEQIKTSNIPGPNASRT
jgi:hypothetical protein